jgi:predicted signal transduction protein with EAL and GGDEF domain
VSLPYYLGQGTLASIGVSIGIAECDSCISDNHVLLVHADRALYKAKKRGKGTFHRVRFFRDDDGRTERAIAQCEAAGR